MTKTPSANAAIAALRKVGVADRLAAKIPGGDIRVLLVHSAQIDAAVAALAARFPDAVVSAEDSLTVQITP